jgi:transmembrane sensor
MEKEEAKQLLQKIREGKATEQERALVDSWYLSYRKDEPAGLSAEDYEIAELLMFSRLPGQQRKVVKLWTGIRIAAGIAAAVAAVVFGVYFFSSNYQDAGIKTANIATVNDIAPGRNGATITLANGKVIELSDKKTGVIVGEELKYNDNTSVIPGYTSSRGNERSLDPAESRDPSQGRDDGIVQNLTAKTQKGQTYQFTLPDGTRVWLNADSKIEFPSNFMNSKTRNVKLSGEAYFAVKHDGRQPFRVESRGQIVEDIGTEFNINAYADEKNIKTTLIEGSARVTSVPHMDEFSHAPKDMSYGREEGIEADVFLTPNQQAVLRGIKLDVSRVEVSQVIAWKEGLFAYNNTTLEEVMRQAARWYDVKVIYAEEALKQKKLSGAVTRYDNISGLLKAISYTAGVKFKIEGRNLLIEK